jgi:Sel1 repeat
MSMLRLGVCLLVASPIIRGASVARAQQVKPANFPQVMRFCGPAACATLTWNNGHYDAVYDRSSGTSTYTVERFTPEAVRIIRRESAGGGTAVLTGRISARGDSVVDGRITWTAGATGTFPYTMTWDLGRAPAAVAREEPDVATVPLGLSECEPVTANKQCGTWSWDGEKYLAVWDQGTVAHMSVQQWNRAGVVLKRSDYAVTAGATGTYTGHWQDDTTILGDATINWPGHFPNSALGPGNIKITWQAWIENTKGRPYVRCDMKVPPPATTADPETTASDAFRAGDMESGACWVRIAAVQGSAKSQTLYGYSLLVGRGVAKDTVQGFEWTQKAARQGQLDAEFNLAKMYKDGVGVSPDSAQANYWTGQAKAQVRDQFAKTLVRAHLNPSGMNILAAADACRQDPENAGTFNVQCAAALQAENSYLRQKAMEVGEEQCGDAAKRNYPNPNYLSDVRNEQFRQCMNDVEADVTARFGAASHP